MFLGQRLPLNTNIDFGWARGLCIPMSTWFCSILQSHAGCLSLTLGSKLSTRNAKEIKTWYDLVLPEVRTFRKTHSKIAGRFWSIRFSQQRITTNIAVLFEITLLWKLVMNDLIRSNLKVNINTEHPWDTQYMLHFSYIIIF